METRSKEEVMHDVEQTRADAELALKNAGEVWSGNNAVASAWRAAKGTYFNAQEKIADTAQMTDEVIRRNLYISLGIAGGVGAIIGFFAKRNPKYRRKRNG